jgi:ectoine hydroxylase-related dioxygenase (phytanoyl-CoA dioxygenase family)|tara:strand:- start:18 stop:857 length:840 start_codon:yes stop_codon:yes gene_type:complete
MAQITHLPSNCSVKDIIEVIEEQGAAIVDDFISDSWLEEFNTAIDPHIETPQAIDHEDEFAKDFFGKRTVRLTGLPRKAPCYIDLMTDERLLKVMAHFLGPNCGQFQLSSSEIIESHLGETVQPLHTDDILWPVKAWVPDKMLQFNTLVAATAFTETNGATHVVPFSHKWDPERVAKPEEIARATMSAGSIVLVPGNTLHAGGANTDGSVRRAIVTSYCLGWLRTYENHFLHSTVEEARQWPKKAQQLLGYDLYRYHDENISGGPLGLYEYTSPQILFQ